MIHCAVREARERKAHVSSGPIVTFSSVNEAFSGITGNLRVSRSPLPSQCSTCAWV
ncbi:TPA: hypothetical protein G8B71_004257 [Salmonella enterica]|uniref:Uncharacterized protein n=1 Tax=Salmonella typhimurium TaxID=90371 RepID=A0A735TI74_SALTM|nr:hypothetical protein [Salmonella enterica subsp. enterica serovar Mbandaka]EDT0784728.1 hypothetical protein [Salmonella enterica]EDV1051721.1 hypothetical protein [Salmonella enterica subsp. enterica]EDY0577671.1 hypothetical protein [Salmonella enterica subsp. enterica serovar Goldcoast]EEB6592883.1 hypothetical protein [Salmonella enterica subsp. enterica serovar Infantis]EEB7252206.1 hypothetical protein [Salmonella enterica subsp. enterica serovar Typhimurium]KAE9798816.1 hypothetical